MVIPLMIYLILKQFVKKAIIFVIGIDSHLYALPRKGNQWLRSFWKLWQRNSTSLPISQGTNRRRGIDRTLLEGKPQEKASD